MSFSVIMPTYKREHTIERALKSLYSQTYADWELIIVDNYGSKYSFEDKRIKYHVYTDKLGDGAGRNYGIPFATKELICFFDDDDYLAPTYMEQFNQAFADPKIMLSRCKIRIGTSDRVAFATPQLVMRRKFARTNWMSCLYNDKAYWGNILKTNGWTVDSSEFKEINEVLVYALHDSKGGYRATDENYE